MFGICYLESGWTARWALLGRYLERLWAVLEASWALLGRSWRLLGALEVFWALSGRYWRPLGRSWDGLGGILGTLGPELGASWELLGPSWERLESSWGRLGGILSALEAVLGTSGELLAACCRSCDFHCFFNGFLDIFEVPRPVLEASWHAWRHLGPLEELLKRLERILSALGGLLKRLEGILSALGAMLVAPWRLFLVNAHGTRIGSAAPGGPSEGRGSILSSRNPE